MLKADKESRIVEGGETRQCAAQRNCREFARSASRLDRMGQPFVFFPTHRASVTALSMNGGCVAYCEVKRATPLREVTRLVTFVFATTLAAPATFLDDLRRRDASGLSGTS